MNNLSQFLTKSFDCLQKNHDTFLPIFDFLKICGIFDQFLNKYRPNLPTIFEQHAKEIFDPLFNQNVDVVSNSLHAPETELMCQSCLQRLMSDVDYL
jgi:hypothetical protein